MSLLVCLGCGCRFAVGLEACPQCWAEEFEEADVAKITSAGPSFPPAGGEPVVEPEAVEPEAPAAAPVQPPPAEEPQAAPAPERPVPSLSRVKDADG